MGWMRVEPQQRNAHPTEDQGGSMNLPTFSRGESQVSFQARTTKIMGKRIMIVDVYIHLR